MINRVKLAPDEYMQGYKYKLYPTKEQAEFFDNCINLDRYIYNWTIETQTKQFELYKSGKTNKPFIKYNKMTNMLSDLKREYDFVDTIPTASARSGIKKADFAYSMYFDNLNNKPKFRTKKRDRKKSYFTRSERTYLFDDKFQIEGLPGKFVSINYNTGYYSDKNKKEFYNVIISKDSVGDYYISYKVKRKKKLEYMNKDINTDIQENISIGIDMNKEKRVQLSNGLYYVGPNLTKEFRQLKRLRRKISKDRKRYNDLINNQEITNPESKFDIPISKRAEKRKQRFRKINKRIKYKNKNFVINTAKNIVSLKPEKGFVLESLNFTDMVKDNHRMSKHMAFTNLGALRDKVVELCMVYNIPVTYANTYYPSSKTCSNCGHIHNQLGSSRIFICPYCGYKIDRDLNAAINLSRLA